MEIEKPFLVYRVLFLLYYKTLRLCYSSDYFAAGWKNVFIFPVLSERPEPLPVLPGYGLRGHR